MWGNWTQSRKQFSLEPLVALDKGEGFVKDRVLLSGVVTPRGCQIRLRTKALGITLNHSAVGSSHRGVVPPTIDTAPYHGHDSSVRTSRRYGMRERSINIPV
jgi:hypothetical protein